MYYVQQLLTGMRIVWHPGWGVLANSEYPGSHPRMKMAFTENRLEKANWSRLDE